MMHRTKRKQSSVYLRFVESGIDDIDAAFIESKRRSRLCIGSDAFRDDVDRLYEELVKGKDSIEDVSFHYESPSYSVEDVLSSVCQVLEIEYSILMSRQRSSWARPFAAKALCDYAGLTQRDVAKIFNLTSGGAVSKQLAKLSRLIKTDKALQKIQEDIDRSIKNR